jgi:hypothetical protein
VAIRCLWRDLLPPSTVTAQSNAQIAFDVSPVSGLDAVMVVVVAAVAIGIVLVVLRARRRRG